MTCEASGLPGRSSNGWFEREREREGERERKRERERERTRTGALERGREVRPTDALAE